MATQRFVPQQRDIPFTRDQPRKYKCIVCDTVVLHPYGLVRAREVVPTGNYTMCVCCRTCDTEFTARYYTPPGDTP